MKINNKKLQETIKQLWITRIELAERTKITEQTLTNIQKGHTNPSLRTMEIISQALESYRLQKPKVKRITVDTFLIK